MKPESAAETLTSTETTPSPDLSLVERLQRGDADASRRFFREQYPGIYHYLLWLTERPEMAEDLAQETFVRAWRHLDHFDGRAPLGPWLHAIAHREFLRALRGRRTPAGLDEIAEIPDARTDELTEAVELRAVIRKLPVEEREVVMLYYLQEYAVQEIAHIVRAPVSTVKYRLSAARSHLRRELNEQPVALRQWAWLPLDQINQLETRLRQPAVGDEFAAVWITQAARIAPEGRSTARQETAAPAPREEDSMDTRLARKVTLAFKGTALSDLCERLRADTGIDMRAGPSIADEKVSLFCKETPLRDVMRQLSRPFGYTWLRSSTLNARRSTLDPTDARPAVTGGERRASSVERQASSVKYRYELVQDLRSQLMEEELRTRDRHASLLALEREMERYRPYLDLSPDVAMARSAKAPPDEKKLLETLAGKGWGPIQMYFRLSPQEQAALRTGQELHFHARPQQGDLPLPPDVARGVLQSWRDWRVRWENGRFEFDPAKQNPEGRPPADVPELSAAVFLKMEQSELGHFTLNESASDFFVESSTSMITGHPIAVGMSPGAHDPRNADTNARLARETALRRQVSFKLMGSGPRSTIGGSAPVTVKPSLTRGERQTTDDRPPTTEAKVTTPDVFEALHQATGMPIVADFYTRLYAPNEIPAQEGPLFEVLNRIGDAMRMRWSRDEAWLQFRTTTFYDDRLKEVPNRLLSRWAASRRERAALSLDDLSEIVQLTDAQLDATSMAEGAVYSWDLAEWDLARNQTLRPHLCFLAGLTPAQRLEAASGAGLTFQRLTLPQQEQFLSLARDVIGSKAHLQELATTVVHVEYTLPGWWLWYAPEAIVGTFPPFQPPRVCERTSEAALETALRIDPRAEASQIRPAKLGAAFIYRRQDESGVHVRRIQSNGSFGRYLTGR